MADAPYRDPGESAFARVVRALHAAEEGVIALLLAAMTLITFVQVVLRYVFNSGLSWAVELSLFLFAWLVLFGVSYGVRVGAHIGVDALVTLLPRRVRRVVALIAVALCMAYAVLIFKGSWDYITKIHRFLTDDLKIPRGIPYAILPVGFALLFLRLAEVAARILRGRSDGFEIGDEGREALEHAKADAEAAAKAGAAATAEGERP